MIRIFSTIGFFALMLFEFGSLSALPAPWHLVALTPLALVALVLGGWGRWVWALALLAGLVFDSFAVFPSGTFIVIMLIFVALVRLFVNRWFTTRSWLSTVTLLAVSMASFYLLLVVFRGFWMLFFGNPTIIISLQDGLWAIALGTLVTTIIGMAAMGGIVILRYFFGRRFLISRATHLSR